ncbi:MAG: tyrosine-type recombinase/integrase [Ruminococcus bicirculans (ex Wegman et al. 2014)]
MRICTLKPENVDLLGRSVKFYGKGSKERLIPVENMAVLSILKRYRLLFEDKIAVSGYFFVNKLGRRMTEQSVRNMLSSYCRQCGVEMHITPHMFRHSFATLLLEEDVDIRYIQRMLGHSSITTTQIYTHVTSSKQKEILKTKHPRNKMDFQ